MTIDTSHHGAQRRYLHPEEAPRPPATVQDAALGLFSDIAHALQTPLACLMGELRHLQLYTPTDGIAHIRHCEHIIANMSALIHNALYISKLEQAQFDAHMQDVSLSELLEEIIEYVTTLTARERIILSSDIQQHVHIRGVPDKLEELIIAILSNAIKYHRQRGKRTLSVSLHANDERVAIYIKDNGIGIASEDLPYVFNRFYRTPHATAQSERGTGLGLAIAKKIADKHGATITIESTLGIGTHVHIIFPCKN